MMGQEMEIIQIGIIMKILMTKKMIEVPERSGQTSHDIKV